MDARAIVIDTPAGACLGWWHAAQWPARRAAILMCRPIGYEALCSYAAYAQLAREFAAAGFDVLRFDYHGCGDSAGGDTDADRVAAWLASIDAATARLLQLSGASQLVYFGMRLGATLAAHAALARGGVDAMVLWAPCATGRAFVRETRAAHASHRLQAVDEANEAEALGTLFTAPTLQAVSALDALAFAQAPTKHAYIAARDDLPGEGSLSDRWRALGTTVVCGTWPGYAAMMSEPRAWQLDPESVTHLLQWLDERHPRRYARQRSATRPAAVPAEAWSCGPRARESIAAFGPAQRLVGVLTEPALRTERADTAVLMLNVGGNYRIGCNRIYVKLARELAAHGWRALRFDVAGIGDSTGSDAPSAGPYRRHSVDDVSCAIDWLAQRGCRSFWLLGICSGSYLAFETALRDERVTGQMLLNSRLLEWNERAGGPWQTAMQQHYKSTRYYRKALLRGSVYARLLRGEIDIWGISRRMVALATARLTRTVTGWFRSGPPSDGVLRKMRYLGARGTETLVVMSAEDDGLDYIEYHLGRRGARLASDPHFRMAIIEDGDHTFSTVSSQRAVIDIVRAHLDALHRERESPTLAPRVAAT